MGENGAYLGWTNKARAVPLEEELRRRGFKLSGSGVERSCPCPKCGGDDRFSYNTKKKAWYCRGCEKGGNTIDLVMLADGVDFNEACTRLVGKPPKANGNDKSAAAEIIVGSYQYYDTDGNLVLVVERVEFQDSAGDFVLKDGRRAKTFCQKRPDPDRQGKFIYDAKGVPPVPYRLPEIIEAIASDRPILIVEGEAKADLLWKWNIAATCCVGGAKKWKPEHSDHLRGADVYLLPDNDNPGWEHANKVGASLSTIAKSIRVVSLPDLPPKGDIVDWAKAGGTREKLDGIIAGAPVWQLPTADDKAAVAKAREDELLDGLMALKGFDFYRKRKEAHKALDVPMAAIDAELQKRREQVPLHGHWIVEPSQEPVDGDSLLRDIIARIRRHIVCSFDTSLTVALWVMFSWVHDEIAVHSPILLVTSAEPECGKTTTLGLISYLAPRAISSVDISKAALFRSIQLWQPSFIIDEFDDVLSSLDSNKAELKSIINSGHTRGQGVIRCIDDEHRPELFSTFAPKSVGMVGRRLPVTTMSRCIVIELRRSTKDEPFEPFAHQDDAGLADLRGRLRRWSIDNADILRDAAVTMPKGFRNRRANNWRLLFAIGDLCSGIEEYGDKARSAAIALEGASDTRTSSTRALIDAKAAFFPKDGDGREMKPLERMSSADLVGALTGDPDGPWVEWKNGKPITQAQLARVLKVFGIAPEVIRLPSGGTIRGYLRTQFDDAWERYL